MTILDCIWKPLLTLEFRFPEAFRSRSMSKFSPFKKCIYWSKSQGCRDFFSPQMLHSITFNHLNFHSTSRSRTMWCESVLCHYVLDPFVSSRRPAASDVTPDRHFRSTSLLSTTNRLWSTVCLPAQPILYWCSRNMSFWSSISFNLAVLMNLLVAFFYPLEGVRGGQCSMIYSEFMMVLGSFKKKRCSLSPISQYRYKQPKKMCKCRNKQGFPKP